MSVGACVGRWEEIMELDKLYGVKSGYLNAGEFHDPATIQVFVSLDAITSLISLNPSPLSLL